MTSRLPPAERAAAGAAALVAALLIAQQVAARSVRDALFLSAYPVSWLPGIMLAAALMAVGGALAFAAALARRPPAVVLAGALLVQAALLTGEWGLAAAQPRLVAAALYVQMALLGPGIISAFWSARERAVRPAHRPAGGGAHRDRRVRGRRRGRRSGLGRGPGAPVPVPPAGRGRRQPAGACWRCRSSGCPLPSAHATTRRAGALAGMRSIRQFPYLRQLAAIVALGALAEVLLDYLLKAGAARALGRPGGAGALLQPLLRRRGAPHPRRAGHADPARRWSGWAWRGRSRSSRRRSRSRRAGRPRVPFAGSGRGGARPGRRPARLAVPLGLRAALRAAAAVAEAPQQGAGGHRGGQARRAPGGRCRDAARGPGLFSDRWLWLLALLAMATSVLLARRLHRATSVPSSRACARAWSPSKTTRSWTRPRGTRSRGPPWTGSPCWPRSARCTASPPPPPARPRTPFLEVAAELRSGRPGAHPRRAAGPGSGPRASRTSSWPCWPGTTCSPTCCGRCAAWRRG